jgi:hypothetical protein
MKKSRVFISGLLLIIALLGLPNAALGAIKPGTNCKVAGQSVSEGSANYICTKTGKKLVWVAKAVAKVPQTPLGSPIAMKAYEELKTAVSKMNFSTSPNIRTIPTPGATSKLEGDIQNNLVFASTYFSDYLPTKYPITAWVIGSPQDLKWYSASWRVAIPWQAENLIGRQDGFSAQVGQSTDGSFALVITSPDQLTTFHEYTHAVQDYLANGKAGLPCWVREGMAEYESNAMMGRNSEVAYKSAMLNLISELSMINFSLFKYKSAGLDYWVNFFATDETRNNGECRAKSSALDPAYSVGGLGFQYLTGQYGRDKVFEFVKNIGQDWKGVCQSPNEKMIPCKSWKTSFKNAFGVEPASAYKSMGAFIVNQIEWSANSKGLSESAIAQQYPESRSIPDYPPLAKRETAGAPCDKKDDISGQLICTSKDGFLFWGAKNSPPGPSTSGGQENSNSQPMLDDLGAPPGVPAPGRTCPNVGDRARYEKTPLICVKNTKTVGMWMIDPNPPSA